jgi:hypothetical protein
VRAAGAEAWGAAGAQGGGRASRCPRGAPTRAAAWGPLGRQPFWHCLTQGTPSHKERHLPTRALRRGRAPRARVAHAAGRSARPPQARGRAPARAPRFRRSPGAGARPAPAGPRGGGSFGAKNPPLGGRRRGGGSRRSLHPAPRRHGCETRKPPSTPTGRPPSAPLPKALVHPKGGSALGFQGLRFRRGRERERPRPRKRAAVSARPWGRRAPRAVGAPRLQARPLPPRTSGPAGAGGGRQRSSHPSTAARTKAPRQCGVNSTTPEPRPAGRRRHDRPEPRSKKDNTKKRKSRGPALCHPAPPQTKNPAG